MNAEPFRGDADFPIIITKADDGTPLPECRGWSCAACGGLYADRTAAEMCCVEPDAVVIGTLPALNHGDGVAK